MIMMTKPRNERSHLISIAIAIPLSMVLISGSCFLPGGLLAASSSASAMPQIAPPPPPQPPPFPPQQRQPIYVTQGNDTIFTYLQEPAQFPGGRGALTSFIAQTQVYPEAAREYGFEGTVTVAFIVDRKGKLSDFNVVGGVSPSIDAEALRIAKKMPKWLPAKENGRAVNYQATVMIRFDLHPGSDPDEVFVVVEEMPHFPGGDEALMQNIISNVRYPAEAKVKGIQGRVILRFCVTNQGKTSKIGVLRGVDPSLDAEAIRVVKNLPDWQPGLQGGRPVNVWYALPVTFALNDTKKGGKQEVEGQNAPPPAAPALPPRPALRTGYDKPPVFKGNEAAIMEFVSNEMQYPEEARKEHISGTVKIRFTIDTEGNVVDPLINESLSPSLDAEALRIAGEMTKWKPASYKRKPVTATYTIPVNFIIKE